MTTPRYRVRITPAARDDLDRLQGFLEQKNVEAATVAMEALAEGFSFLETLPYACRKAALDPRLRELIVPFGSTGYVALFWVDEAEVVVMAVRHQREEDFH